jgi:hypothetical protein
VAEISRKEGHLIVAAIRVLSHLRERSPRPEEVAELLDLPPAVLRVKLAALQAAQIVALVESAFDTHLEVRDYGLLEDLPADETGGDLTADLADFDRRKQEEAEKMERLFGEGDHKRKQAERLKKMDEQLRDFRKQKKPSPFGDD